MDEKPSLSVDERPSHTLFDSESVWYGQLRYVEEDKEYWRGVYNRTVRSGANIRSLSGNAKHPAQLQLLYAQQESLQILSGDSYGEEMENLGLSEGEYWHIMDGFPLFELSTEASASQFRFRAALYILMVSSLAW